MLEMRLDRIIATLDKDKVYVLEIDVGDASATEIEAFGSRICKAFSDQGVNVFVVPKNYKVNIEELGAYLEKIKNIKDKFDKSEPKEIDC